MKKNSKNNKKKDEKKMKVFFFAVTAQAGSIKQNVYSAVKVQYLPNMVEVKYSSSRKTFPQRSGKVTNSLSIVAMLENCFCLCTTLVTIKLRTH